MKSKLKIPSTGILGKPNDAKQLPTVTEFSIRTSQLLNILIICINMIKETFGELFTATTRHLIPAAVKVNGTEKGVIRQRSIKKPLWQTERLRLGQFVRRHHNKWASSWDYGTYIIGDQRRLRRACAYAQSRQSLRCSHTQSMIVDEGSYLKSDI